MKSKVLVVSCLAASFLCPAVFAGSSPIPFLPEKVFTPLGFDDNDRAEIVLHGHFPDSCYRAGAATATLVNGVLLVKNLAYRDSEGECLKATVPWTTTVVVGTLAAGTYPVYVKSPSGDAVLFERLVITRAKSKSIDDRFYAYVNGALVKADATNPIPSITITGSFGMTCMYISDVKVERAKRDVINILPIVALDRAKPCGYPFVPIPFEKKFRLAGPLESRSTLFHIRSINGQSLNRVVEY